MTTSGNPRIEALFPNLLATGYGPTSPDDPGYNCIAWATGSDDAWWQPVSVPGYYWPNSVPQDGTVESLVALFKSLGFEICAGPEPESGYEKVALYGSMGTYTHAARQLPNGKWTSKLGALEDIEHDTLAGLVGTEYGTVAHVMRRRIGQTGQPSLFPDDRS